MIQLKGRLQLAKFRIKQNPITPLLLIMSIILFVFSLIKLVQNNYGMCISLAVLSFACSTTCSIILKDITKTHLVEINGIKLKYGIKVNTGKEVK
jgi:hypothetical protein